MVNAIVKDMATHLSSLEKERGELEGHLAAGGNDDTIALSTQKLVQIVKDYKSAAAHVKKHCAKPKPKKAAKGGDEKPGE